MKRRTLDFIQHQEQSKNTPAKHPNPHPRVLQDVTVAESRSCIGIFGKTSRQLHWGGSASRDDVESTGGETDDGQEKTDTDSDGGCDGAGDESSEPLTETEEGEEEEDDAFEEDGGEGFSVADRTGSLGVSDVVS